MKKSFVCVTLSLLFLTGCQKPAQPELTPIAESSPIQKELSPVSYKTGQTENITYESFFGSEKSTSGNVSFTIDDVKELNQINETKAPEGEKFVLVLLTIKGNKDNKVDTSAPNFDNFKTFWYYLTNGSTGYSEKPIEEDFLAKEYKATPYVNIKLTDPNPKKTFMVFELKQNFSVQQFVVKWRGKTKFEQKKVNLQ